MKEIFLKIRYFKRELPKSLKKLTLFFLMNLVSFNGQDYEKLKRPRISDQSLSRLQNKFSKTTLSVM